MNAAFSVNKFKTEFRSIVFFLLMLITLLYYRGLIAAGANCVTYDTDFRTER